jgi:hypothetical protein
MHRSLSYATPTYAGKGNGLKPCERLRYFNPLIFLADTLRVFYRGAYHEPFTYDNSETSPHRLP